jgi:hypothetical protein
VKCTAAYKRNRSSLTIYAQYLLDMALKAGLDASFYSVGLKRDTGEIEEI